MNVFTMSKLRNFCITCLYCFIEVTDKRKSMQFGLLCVLDFAKIMRLHNNLTNNVSLFCLYFYSGEGVEIEYSNPVLIDLKNATSFSKDFDISLPSGVVAGSQRIVVTARCNSL